MSAKEHLTQVYDLLYDHFGPQGWWPGETPFEVCLGAILTQNTAWTNVEKAIGNIKAAGLLDFDSLRQTPVERVAALIKPAGYFNIKAKRLRSFLDTIHREFKSFDQLFALPLDRLRETLLSINGIGPETADSMVLYAFKKTSFVVDAYTKRVLVRHSLAGPDDDYYRLKDLFESNLPYDEKLYNEYHALIVMTGKHFCKNTKPLCEQCPLRQVNGGPVLVEL